jgi:hypothetical protein
MPGLDPGIHEIGTPATKTWMAGPSPAMTDAGALAYLAAFSTRGMSKNRSPNAEWKLPKKGTLLRAINRFSNSTECGEFVDRNTLLRTLRASDSTFETIIRGMRDIRYDIRTPETHPIIQSGVLCTYPFPLLSPRALVESRAQLLPLNPTDQKAWMTAG